MAGLKLDTKSLSFVSSLPLRILFFLLHPDVRAAGALPVGLAIAKKWSS